MNAHSIGGSGGTQRRAFFVTLGLSIVGLAIYLLATRTSDFSQWDRFTWELILGIALAGLFLITTAALCRSGTLDRWTGSPGAKAYGTLERIDRSIPSPLSLLRSLLARRRG